MTKDAMIVLSRWHQTKLGLLTFGAIELAITYGFASLAIDRGSWWWYVLALVFIVGSLRNAVRLTCSLVIHRGKH